MITYFNIYKYLDSNIDFLTTHVSNLSKIYTGRTIFSMWVISFLQVNILFK